eukprot:1177042-Rhodomonas_salina.1
MQSVPGSVPVQSSSSFWRYFGTSAKGERLFIPHAPRYRDSDNHDFVPERATIYVSSRVSVLMKKGSTNSLLRSPIEQSRKIKIRRRSAVGTRRKPCRGLQIAKSGYGKLRLLHVLRLGVKITALRAPLPKNSATASPWYESWLGLRGAQCIARCCSAVSVPSAAPSTTSKSSAPTPLSVRPVSLPFRFPALSPSLARCRYRFQHPARRFNHDFVQLGAVSEEVVEGEASGCWRRVTRGERRRAGKKGEEGGGGRREEGGGRKEEEGAKPQGEDRVGKGSGAKRWKQGARKQGSEGGERGGGANGGRSEESKAYRQAERDGTRVREGGRLPEAGGR